MTTGAGPQECRRFAALIDRDLDGELTPAQRAFADAHLAECPACRARRTFQADLRRRLDVALEVDAMPPPELLDRMARLLEQEELRAGGDAA